MWKKRRFNSKDDESFGCTEKVPRGSESKESLDENRTQKNWKDRESNICRIWFAYLIKISNLEKRRGKNFKFYALLYFQDNDSIIKNSTCIPFSKVRNHAYEDFDVIESGIWEKKNLFAHLMYIN